MRSWLCSMIVLLGVACTADPGDVGAGTGELVVTDGCEVSGFGLLPAGDFLAGRARGGDTGATGSWAHSGDARVVIGAPTIAGSVAKYPRHRVMIGLALALTVFNALTFLAPTFEWVAISRLLAGLPHGAYFGIGALVAAEVLGPGMRAKGVAFAKLNAVGA